MRPEKPVANIDRVYTVNECAELLRTTRATVLAQIRRGRLRATRVGREYRITETAINDYLHTDQDGGGVTQAGKPGKT